MFSKSTLLAILATTTSLASASPSPRAVGPISFTNKSPVSINYIIVGPYGTVSGPGTIPATGSQSFSLPPVGQGYSLKLASGKNNPASSSNILQLEYSLNSDNNIFFDWSAVNGPDPFVAYKRTVAPVNPSGTICQPITCAPGQNDTRCESTSAGQGPIHVCPAGNGGYVLNVQIGGN